MALMVEHLGDGVDHIHVVDGNDDGFPQVLIALDVGRDADFVDDACDHGFNAVFIRTAEVQASQGLPTPDFFQPLYQRFHVTGLQHQIPHP